jgi:hypothetical protein
MLDLIAGIQVVKDLTDAHVRGEQPDLPTSRSGAKPVRRSMVRGLRRVADALDRTPPEPIQR